MSSASARRAAEVVVMTSASYAEEVRAEQDLDTREEAEALAIKQVASIIDEEFKHYEEAIADTNSREARLRRELDELRKWRRAALEGNRIGGTPWYGPSMMDNGAASNEADETDAALIRKLDEMFEPENVRKSQAHFYEMALHAQIDARHALEETYLLLRDLFNDAPPDNTSDKFKEWEQMDKELGI